MHKIDKSIIKDIKSWPFSEAVKIIDSFGGIEKFVLPAKGYILLETGYGPSGLPHIGTFGEVVRTTMVKNSLENLIDASVKIVTFSDDMDGLRKVPDNVPNKDMLKKNIGKPLTSIPDPFEKFQSFGHHNNAKLRSFLDEFNFDYDFVSSTEKYREGFFDSTIIEILQNYERILEIILPTLRKERKSNYSPFLPISKQTGKVLQVKIDEYRPKHNSVIYTEPTNQKKVEVLVTGGQCKMQWKVDWAMRWMALGVDYEMCGKDLTESVDLASKICKAIGKKSPVNLIYEMFLDEKGEKISKSIGNGIGVDEWLRYGSPESLSLYMYQKPKSAKKLFFDVIPKTVDEYISHYKSYDALDPLKKYDSPIWHIHAGSPKKFKSEISFNSLTNLVSICNTDDKEIIWGFINQYDNEISPTNNPEFDKLIDYAINYYKDFVLPNKNYLKIDDDNIFIFEELRDILKFKINKNSSAEEIQTLLYEVGKKYKFSNLKDFFKLIYQVILGQEQGPRLGSFIKLFGVEETINVIEKAIELKKL
ncbi:MAG: lysine--tRNA ligase [Pelagibacteraceae bacterium]|nr:lysine--tRNA ligase [Pelagibacteraceae bacterium]|tara:strand:- start:27860 stop:29458 length:1599 start_codon:yes stop_codon:yes gene_type:complete